MKYCVVITDGASGEPIAEFNNKTSLEQAFTPHLDILAAKGLVGLAKTVPAGLEPASNIACTSIFGYDPQASPIGRGAIEGAALGIRLADDEVALRLNLTHVSAAGIMESYSTNNISISDGSDIMQELASALDDDVFRLYTGKGFRGILVVKGHPQLMETSMPAAHNITDEAVADYPVSGPEASLIVDYERRARTILANSPVNARRLAQGQMTANEVFLFWPGRRPENMPDFFSRYGKRAGIVSGVDLLHGIAFLTGIQSYQVEGVTDGPDNDYTAQGQALLNILDEQDLVVCHVEAPDAEGHDGNASGKVAAIEAIDREILARLRTYAASKPLRLLVMPDHPTPVQSKRHSHDLVPFVMSGSGILPASGNRLTEAEAVNTGLVVDPGYQLMGMLLAED